MGLIFGVVILVIILVVFDFTKSYLDLSHQFKNAGFKY